MKKLMMILSLLNFCSIFFGSEQQLNENNISSSEDILRIVLKQHGYDSKQIDTWRRLMKITQKEEQGFQLTKSEENLANLEDEIK